MKIAVQGGDIGDEGWRPLRVVLVWEGVCAKRPEVARRFRDRLKRSEEEDWDRTVRAWEVYEKPLQRIHSLDVRGVFVDIVTFEGEQFCDALRERLDRMHVSVARVDWYEDAQAFARELRTSPDIQYVVDSDTDRLRLYGRRGMRADPGEDWGMFI